jgi:hypothetical protein
VALRVGLAPSLALHLDPACLLAGPIRAVASLRDDAFEASLAALGEKRVAIIEVFRVAHGADAGAHRSGQESSGTPGCDLECPKQHAEGIGRARMRAEPLC